ncbi:peptide ABC transporter substrate-binding protein [Robertmurraya korlensis]|uniref:peptide ABC transporter substrate-binding protein n=1 Tax=Robertmurraya korlensis TaxID=519977 RepID=UPI002041E84F|nr:peptide ABC transporter substrate-binding protein [Robertmurraya korlensis]MCM3602416.1 peptide ABC transporter substrate-binding protein [Robertmurraya korlensis]
MKKSKFSLLLVLTLVLSMFLAACSGGNKEDEATPDNDSEATGSELAENQEITVLESAEIPSMDSVLAEDTVGFTMINNVNEGLFRLDQEQNPIPALSDGEPTVSEDGTVYTFKLREAKWSNGDAVTAQDFVYAWQRALLPDSASFYGPYIMAGVIKNADKVKSGEVAPDELGVKALSDTELEVTLEKPVAYINALLAFPTFYPQNQKFVEEKGADYAKNAENLIFNGPFKMTKWDGVAATEWTLEKNEEYWDAENVTLTKINYNTSKDPQAAANAFEAGQADVTPKLSTPAVISQYEGDSRLVTWLEPTEFWLKFNQENKALANKNIRMALALAFDKDALVNDILQNGSLAANYAVPAEFVKHPETGEDFRAANGDFNTYDAEKAKDFWTKGLDELGVKTLELNFLGGDTETSKTVDAFIKDQLQTNLEGLTINLESVPFSVRLDREDTQDYDILHAGWGPDYPDPMTYSDLWLTGGGHNKMSYSNAKYDELVKSAQNELAAEPAERFEALQEAEKVLMEDAALAPTYQRASNLLVNEKLEGFTYHIFGPEYSWKFAKLNK